MIPSQSLPGLQTSPIPSLIPRLSPDSDTQPPNIPAVTRHSQPPNTRQITSGKTFDDIVTSAITHFSTTLNLRIVEPLRSLFYVTLIARCMFVSGSVYLSEFVRKF